MDEIASFGDWLRRRRKALDLTQAALAERAGCVPGTIKSIEADARRPSRQLAERLADVLELREDERAAFLKAARAELSPDRLTSPTELARAVPSAVASPAADANQRTLPTGTVTFLFTDIEGSTQLWEQHPHAMQRALARHDAILVDAITAHSGVVVKCTGDGLLAAFPEALQALTAALSVQRAFQAEDWGRIGPLRVRMALHSGAAEVRNRDYFGPTLNRAARLLAVGHGGQVLLSRTTVELVRDHLPDDVTLRDLREQHLKDLSRPEHIFQLITPDLPAGFPPLNTLDSRRTNLPAQPTPLIGRDQEVIAVRELLRQVEKRLVTLTGPGGTGKTRLALQVAAEALDDFADGVWFVDLAPISDVELVIATIMQTIGLKEVAGQPPLEQLKAYLRDKQVLLVLDNFEQVVAAAPRVAELLAAAPQLKVLVTSRVVLRLRGEQEYAVPPLALPGPKQLPPLEALSQYAAVELFIQRAQNVKPDFQVTNANAPAVAEICARLDGLPLAIELAAARSKLFAPELLLKRLEQRLSVLTGGPRDLPVRQQTIRNTIDWSYTLLADGEKQLFARLGIFVGGCTLESAEAVCYLDGAPPMDVVEGIAALVDKSLLRQVPGADDEPRFVMLETIREYAREHLEQSKEAEQVKRQHAHYFLNLAELAESYLYGSTQGVWLDRLEAEHGNLRATLEWSQATGDAELGLRLAVALERFWWVRGFSSEGRRWLKAGLARSSGALASTRAKALFVAGEFAISQTDYTAARAMFEASIALFREVGDKPGIANALTGLGWIAFRGGDYSLARACFEESLPLFREVSDIHGLAMALGTYGYITDGLGDATAARASAEESQTLLRETGNQAYLAEPLTILGNVARRQADYDAARAHYDEGLALWRETRDKPGIAEGHRNLGALARAQGEYVRAAAHFVESLTIESELGHKPHIPACLEGLAWVAGEQGQPKQAAQLLGAAEALREASGASIPPADHAEYERTVTAVRAQLDAATFAAAWAAGRALSLEQAIAYALEG
jgi:predicted ATPase/class 3 adenylate cyclase